MSKPDEDTIVAIQNRCGFCYLMGFQGAFSGITFFLTNFISYRKLFFKDKDSRLYSELPFFLAQLTYLFPVFMVLYISVILVYYYVLDLNSDPDILNNIIQTYFFMFIGGFVVGQNYAAFLGALCDKLSTVIALVPILVTPFSMSSGFFASLRTATFPIQWLAYLNPLRFAYQGYMIIEFQNAEEYVDACVTYIECPDDPSEQCQIPVPEDSISQCDPEESMDFIQNDVLTNMLYICGLIVLFGLLAYIVLKFKTKSKQIKYKKSPKLRTNIKESLKTVKNITIQELHIG